MIVLARNITVKSGYNVTSARQMSVRKDREMCAFYAPRIVRTASSHYSIIILSCSMLCLSDTIGAARSWMQRKRLTDRLRITGWRLPRAPNAAANVRIHLVKPQGMIYDHI